MIVVFCVVGAHPAFVENDTLYAKYYPFAHEIIPALGPESTT